MRLSERLEKIMELAGTGQAAADVGTDHAHVPIELVRRGAFAHVYAMDIRRGPLAGAAENVSAAGLEQQITLRLGDGLHPLEAGEADTVLISGMGGPLMERILTEGREKLSSVRRLVLSPQSELPHFRRFLSGFGWRVTAEAMVEEEGKFYLILQAQPGEEEPMSEEEYQYGKLLLREKSPELKLFIEREIAVYNEILSDLAGRRGQKAEARRQQVCEEKALAERSLALLGEEIRHESM